MNNKKELLFTNLNYDTYCRLAPSHIHGVGVVAIKNIPKGTNPFMLPGKKCKIYNTIEFTKKEINKLPIEIQKLIKDFIAPSENKTYFVPKDGLNSLDMSFYLNHSENNNVDIIQSKCEFYEFITNRDIKIGEELTINYQIYESKI